MRALTATAIVRSDHTLTMDVPADVPAGAHEVVIVLPQSKPPVSPEVFLHNWPVHQTGPTDPACTYRREDIYGDDGR